MLCLENTGLSHKKFIDIKGLVRSGDVLVINNTRVLKARLKGRKASGGVVEILLERLLTTNRALCQVRASKALKMGGQILLAQGLATSLGQQGQFYELEFSTPLLDLLDAHGEMPLPPYIDRSLNDMDEQRYQTVFGTQPGAVAAPTAGLHFSHDLLADLIALGVKIAQITLHVGAGTFAPVRGAVEDHVMHKEWYAIAPQDVAIISQAKEAGGRVIAVGTTVVRTLESVVQQNRGLLVPAVGETQLFIKPGFRFQLVDALVTNFHLPKSTLMMLIAAFAGQQRVLAAYREAVEQEYRFFSYGDACWLEKYV